MLASYSTSGPGLSVSVTETRAGKIGAAEVPELSEGGKKVRVMSTDIRLKS